MEKEKKKKTIIICGSIILGICLIVGLAFLLANTSGPLIGTTGISDNNTGNVELVGTRKEGSTFYITTRVGTSTSNNSVKDFITSDNNYNDIYPGAIVEAGTSTISANQKLIDENNISRDKLGINVNVKGESTFDLNIKNPNRETIENYIRKELKSHTGTAETTVRNTLVNNQKQLANELGLTNDYRIDYKAIQTGNKNYMIAVFDQVYYSVKAEFQKDITINGVDSSNNQLAEITDVDYGRRVIVMFTISTTYSMNPIEEWKASLTTTGFKDLKDLKNAAVTVYSIGGSSDDYKYEVFNPNDIQTLNNYIASELNYSKDRVAIPLSYKMNYIKDGSQVYANQSTENSNIKVEKREGVKIQFDTAYNYDTNHARLYAKKIIGVNNDGSYQLGPWLCLRDSKSKNQEFYVDGEYAEFAFSFDITGGKKWPYTDVFWKASQPAPKDIYIEWGGGSYTPWIEITVDGNRVVDISNLDSHSKDKFE